MRARLALDVAGVEVEHREVSLSDKPAAMLDASPKGTVPVLVRADGAVLEESLDIMDWALAQNDPEHWLSGRDRASVEAFLAHFKEPLDRYKYASRYDPSRKRGDIDTAQRDIAMAALRDFTRPLDETRYLSGERPSYSDMASFPFVRQFAAVEPDWWAQTASRPLQDWLSSLIGSERFARIMVKHPVWEPARKD